MKIGINS